MGREARRVPLDWNHPIDWDIYAERERIVFKPLHDDFTESHARWTYGLKCWLLGRTADLRGGWVDHHEPCTEDVYREMEGAEPKRSDYMPVWPADVAVGWQMYETTTEGTPISPVCASPEDLARWLFAHDASAFGSHMASEAEWLSCIIKNHGMHLMLKRTDP